MKQVWFVTGSSRGFGRALVRAALDAGDLVAATARQPGQLADLSAEYGDSICPIALDVTDAAAARAAITKARERFGRLDVIVNNAGYANVSPIETTTDEDFRAQFETNFWGVYNVSKAAIPVLREQGGGIVMQFSSMGGRVGGSPGIASYQAAKFAIDGFSRVLQAETAPFGVKVIVVEPSGFKTDWAGSSMIVRDIPEAYTETVGTINRRVRQNPAGPAGDPVRAAEILVRIAKHRDIPYHLPLGVTAAEGSIRLDEQLLAEDRKWRAVAAPPTTPSPTPSSSRPTRPTELAARPAAVAGWPSPILAGVPGTVPATPRPRHALLSALRGPWTHTRDPIHPDVGDVPGRWVVHRREADIGTKIAAGESLEQFGSTSLGNAGSAIDDKVFVQAHGVTRVGLDGQRDPAVVADVTYLAVLGKVARHDLVPV